MTGVLDPDATGTYLPIGPYGGKPSYQLTANGFFLWWDVGGRWVINAERGVLLGGLWERIDPAIEGLYSPTPPATGDATVTVI